MIIGLFHTEEADRALKYPHLNLDNVSMSKQPLHWKNLILLLQMLQSSLQRDRQDVFCPLHELAEIIAQTSPLCQAQNITRHSDNVWTRRVKTCGATVAQKNPETIVFVRMHPPKANKGSCDLTPPPPHALLQRRVSRDNSFSSIH